MAGIIGAEGNNSIGISGVNWKASMLPLKFLDSRGQGTTANAVDAIEFAVQLKVTGQANVRVMAAGWGDHVFSRALMDAVERAFMHDILFVASAGNSASDNDADPVYPAGFALPNVISATATTNQDTLSSQSNRGANTVHLGAPGVGILSTFPGGGYAYGTGSSLAAAHVSGAAALVLSLCPDLGAADLRDILLTNVQPLSSLVGLVKTRGRLSAEHALGACDRPAFKLTPAAVTLSVARGDSVSVGVQVDPTAGYVGDVTMEVDGLPAGASASYVPPTVTTPASATLVITTLDTTPVGTYLLTLRGRDIGETVRTTPVWLQVLRRRR
jgi:subtilisin family serine protease